MTTAIDQLAGGGPALVIVAVAAVIVAVVAVAVAAIATRRRATDGASGQPDSLMLDSPTTMAEAAAEFL